MFPLLTRKTPGAFTLVEMLIVISLIAVLVAMLLPAVKRAKSLAIDVHCANNLRQITIGLNSYLPEENHTIFWRGDQTWVGDPLVAGMDWYIYGGRETGNHGGLQGGLFNALSPRPLNPYINQIDTFHCPYDSRAWDWAGFETHFELVGNSYVFNTYGWPFGPVWGGLAGVRSTDIPRPSRTILFLDTSLVKSPGSWHHDFKGNVAFCDGHVAFMERPSPFGTRGFTWAPD